MIEMLDRLKRADHIEGMIFKRELLRGVALVMHAVAAEEPRRGFHGLLVHVDALHRFRAPAAQQKAAVSCPRRTGAPSRNDSDGWSLPPRCIFPSR